MASQAHVQVLRGTSILQVIVGVSLQVAYLRRDRLLCTIPKSARFFLPYTFQVYQGSFGPKHLTPFTNNNLYNRKQVMHGLCNNGKEGERQLHFMQCLRSSTTSIQSFRHTYKVASKILREFGIQRKEGRYHFSRITNHCNKFSNHSFSSPLRKILLTYTSQHIHSYKQHLINIQARIK